MLSMQWGCAMDKFDSQAFEWLLKAVADARDELENIYTDDPQSEESWLLTAKFLEEALQFGSNILKDMESIH